VIGNVADTHAGLNVSNNTFQNSGQNIYISNSSNVGKGILGATISGNKFQGNTYPYTPYSDMPSGHINFFGGGNGIQITGNNISGGTNMSGIRVAGYYLYPGASAPRPFYNLVIRYNTIQNLTGTDGTGNAAGVHFYNVPDSGVPVSPRAVLTSAQPTVRDNAFISTSGPGISYTKGVSNPLATIIAQYNYWGSPGGPNGTGGTGVSGNVDYSNWLTAPPPTNFLNLPLILR
jgi:hypothetical protein